MEPYIKIKNLTKGFKKRVVLDNINLEIFPGEIFGIIGMSGSGKSTLLNSLIGFIEPEKGDTLFYSKKAKKFKSIHKDPINIRREFGFATQAASFYPTLTIKENLHHFGTLYGLPRKVKHKNAENLLKMTGLFKHKDTLANNLSGGMEKKLSIACSLIHNPKLLILDEPTADLDPLSRIETWDLIKGIHKLGTTVIVASHFLAELEEVCDRVCILYGTKVAALGSPDEIKSKYFKNEEIVLRSSPGNYKKFSKNLKNAKKVIQKDKKLSIYTDNSKKTIIELLRLLDSNKEQLLRLDVSKPSLAEVFTSLKAK